MHRCTPWLPDFTSSSHLPQLLDYWTRSFLVEKNQCWLTAQAEMIRTVIALFLGGRWRRALFTSSFWASSSRAPRTCCDPRSSQQTPSWRAGGYGRYTAAWSCWCRCCFALTTCRFSAAACWSRRSWLSSSGRNSTMMRLKPPSCTTGLVRPSFTFR